MERRTQKPTTEAVALEKELIDGVGLTQFARKSKSERVLWVLCGMTGANISTRQIR
jgi:hypothetical protein